MKHSRVLSALSIRLELSRVIRAMKRCFVLVSLPRQAGACFGTDCWMLSCCIRLQVSTHLHHAPLLGLMASIGASRSFWSLAWEEAVRITSASHKSGPPLQSVRLRFAARFEFRRSSPTWSEIWSDTVDWMLKVQGNVFCLEKHTRSSDICRLLMSLVRFICGWVVESRHRCCCWDLKIRHVRDVLVLMGEKKNESASVSIVTCERQPDDHRRCTRTHL